LKRDRNRDFWDCESGYGTFQGAPTAVLTLARRRWPMMAGGGRFFEGELLDAACGFLQA